MVKNVSIMATGSAFLTTILSSSRKFKYSQKYKTQEVAYIADIFISELFMEENKI